MHPEIRQDGPGACPICGMALEPVVVTADTGPSQELRDMTRRFWFGVVLSVPVLVLGMGRDLVPWLQGSISATTSAWVQIVLATPCCGSRPRSRTAPGTRSPAPSSTRPEPT